MALSKHVIHYDAGSMALSKHVIHYGAGSMALSKHVIHCREHGTLQTRYPLWFTVGCPYYNLTTPPPSSKNKSNGRPISATGDALNNPAISYWICSNYLYIMFH